ncbi:hypothetical protein ACVOMS_25330 [Bradyrhizobium guangxiense]
MTGEETTIVAGIEIPSADPVFLALIFGVHIPLGLACVAVGASAMLSEKRRGRHSTFGTIYFWCLLALFVSASALSFMRWAENYHLFFFGAMSFACAWTGRAALRYRWSSWVRIHIGGMGLSYVLMLVAFYVDNGKQLPVWKELPHVTYWLLPMIVGVPLILRSLLWPPMGRAGGGASS